MELTVTRVQRVTIHGATERYSAEELAAFAEYAAYEGDVGNLEGTLYLKKPGEDGEDFSWRDINDEDFDENFYGHLSYTVEDVDLIIG